MTQTPDDLSTKTYEPYKTSDTPYAAFLHYSGHKLVGSRQDPNDFKREVCIFIFADDIPQLEQEWRYGKAVGDLKRYHRSLKIVNRYVNEARNKREDEK
jgi:hypothetical protein